MVRCADCGFLALRRGDGELIEADRAYRRTGAQQAPPDPPVGWVGQSGARPPRSDWCWPLPLCFAMQIQDPTGEFEELLRAHGQSETDAVANATHPDQAARQWFVHNERTCTGFTRWQMGFTPKEHREMLDRQWMIEREDRRDGEMREREDRRDDAMRAREDRRDNEARVRHRREILAFGVAIGLATVVGSMIEAAWIGKPW